jgi:hypothetical protein
MATTERELRAARNQLLFRTVNENILKLGEVLKLGESADATATARDRLVCECDRAECHKPISMSVEEFAAIDEKQNRFVVHRGHEAPDVEDVVAGYNGYLIVAKRGAAEEFVQQHS